jgi:hypothetical protein
MAKQTRRRTRAEADRKIVQIRRPPIEIVDWEVGVNLKLDGGWSRARVAAVCRGKKLKHGQAFIMFNNSSMFGGSGSHPPKCRIYWCWNGEYLTCIPCVDDNDQVSYQLRLNEWMRKSFGTSLTNINEIFSDFETAYISRADRLAKMAEKAEARLQKKAG